MVCKMIMKFINYLNFIDSDPLKEKVTVILKPQHENLVSIDPIQFEFSAGSVENQEIVIKGLRPGHLEVTADSVPNEKWM